MATSSTLSTIANTSTATFDAWVNEIYTALVTNCGLTHISATMDTSQMAVPSTTNWNNTTQTSFGYYMLTFNDASGQGPLVTGATNPLVQVQGGSGYDGGGSATFSSVALAGGSGTGAFASVVVASGAITSVTPVVGGNNFNLGDQMLITSANMVAAGASGGGTGASAFVPQLTSAASPVLIKMEFGNAQFAGGTSPQIWLTVGSSWGGAGTISSAQNGAVTPRSALLVGNAAPISATQAYVSRYMYNSTYGSLLLNFKQGGVTNSALGSALIYRHTGTNGFPISNGVTVLTAYVVALAGGGNANNGAAIHISYTANNVLPTSFVAADCIGWLSIQNIFPGNNAFTLENGTVFVFPTYTVDPVFRYSNMNVIGALADIPLNATVSCDVIGTASLTYIQIGAPFAVSGNFAGQSQIIYGVMALWQ